jgi:hypothetical protein
LPALFFRVSGTSRTTATCAAASVADCASVLSRTIRAMATMQLVAGFGLSWPNTISPSCRGQHDGEQGQEGNRGNQKVGRKHTST